MATSPFGGFADLSSYRALVNAQKAQQLAQGGALNQLLGNVLQGAQQGNDVVNLPDIIQQTNQLRSDQALQSGYKTQLLNEALQNALDPNRQLANQIQAKVAIDSITPGTGTVQIPTEFGSLPIQQPTALTPEQNATITVGGLSPSSLPLSQADNPIVPIMNVGGKATGFGTDLGKAIEEATALSKAKSAGAYDIAGLRNNSNGLRYVQDAQGNFYALPTRGDPTATAVTTGDGSPLTGQVKPITGTTSLTANAKASILAKAGTAGITREQIDSNYTKDGVIDYDQIILDSNKTLAQDKKFAAEEKAKQIPAADRTKATGFIGAYTDLNSLVNEVKNLQAEGKEPGAWKRAVGTALEAPPDGILSALYQGVIGQSLTADDKQLNALKARVRSAITKANAGLSQTEREIANVSQYTPKTNDTLEETLQKAAGLQDYIKNQVQAITTDPKDWLRSLNEAPNSNAPAMIKVIDPQGRVGSIPSANIQKALSAGYKKVQ